MSRCLGCGHLLVERSCPCPCHKTFQAHAERLQLAITEMHTSFLRWVRR